MKLPTRAGTLRVWTEKYLLIVVMAVLTMIFSVIALMDGADHVWAELLLVILVIAGSVRAGAVGGLVVGLAGAALHIALGSIDDDWSARGTTLAVITLCSFLLYGWGFGLTAAHLRRRQEVAQRQAATVGAGLSQGLLTAAEGKAVLEMEAERARLSGDRLTVLIITATVRDGVGPRQAAHALRAVARTFEAAASCDQYPVRVSEDRLAMVIPGGEPQDGDRLEQSLLLAMNGATYADREAGARPSASSALIIQSNIVLLTESQVRAETLFGLPERRLARAEQRAAVARRTAA